MAWSVKVAGTTRDAVRDTLDVEATIEERSTATVTIETDTTVTFVRGDTFEVLDGTTIVFSGLVETVDLAVSNPDSLRYHAINAVDWHRLADRRLVALSYENQTAAYIVRDIITQVLTDEGIAEDSGNSSIDTGPTVEGAVFNYVTAAEALQSLADLAGFSWWIDVDRYLWFKARGDVTSPWALTWDNIDDTVPALKHANPAYRNKQYVKGGVDQTSSQVESFLGDGVTTSFTVGYPIATVPTIKVDTVSKTVGIRGVDTGDDWYWNKGDNTVTQDSGGTVLTSSNTLEVTYVGEFPVVVVSDDQSEIDRMAALEGAWSSGTYEAVEDQTEAGTVETGFQTAAALLSKYAQEAETLTFSTIRSGLEPGQLLTVTLAELGVVGEEFLATGVNIEDLDGTIIIYRVTCVTGPFLGTWARLFDFVVNRGRAVIVRENISEDEILATQKSVSEAWSWSEGVVETVWTCPTVNTTLYPSTTLYPC